MAIAAPLKEKPVQKPGTTVYPILMIIGICHMLNDSLQAVIPAMFPILERSMSLTFTQLGIIAFTLNMVSSVMQPVVGWYTDKRPRPYALPIGLTASMLGILGLAFAPSFVTILCCVFFIRKAPVLLIWPPAQNEGLPSPFIRSEETQDKRWRP